MGDETTEQTINGSLNSSVEIDNEKRLTNNPNNDTQRLTIADVVTNIKMKTVKIMIRDLTENIFRGNKYQNRLDEDIGTAKNR